MVSTLSAITYSNVVSVQYVHCIVAAYPVKLTLVLNLKNPLFRRYANRI